MGFSVPVEYHRFADHFRCKIKCETIDNLLLQKNSLSRYTNKIKQKMERKKRKKKLTLVEQKHDLMESLHETHVFVAVLLDLDEES